MRRIVLLIVVAGGVLVLAGCGNKGPLLKAGSSEWAPPAPPVSTAPAHTTSVR